MFRDGPCLRSAPVWAPPPCSAAARWRARPNLVHRRLIGIGSFSGLPRSRWFPTARCRLVPPKGTFIGVPDEEVRKMLSDNFLSPDNVVLEQNSPIVNTGDKLVLFDTGMGTLKLFGPTTGRQQKSMAEAGIKPEEIDAVVLSHAHIDHIGGIVDSADKVLFPNAQFYIAQSDFDFWTDESKVGGPLKDFVL